MGTKIWSPDAVVGAALVTEESLTAVAVDAIVASAGGIAVGTGDSFRQAANRSKPSNRIPIVRIIDRIIRGRCGFHLKSALPFFVR